MTSVLIVEDDDADRYVLRRLLSAAKINTVVVSTVPDALVTLENDRGISLLVTDIRLGSEMSGVELAKFAREKKPRIKVLYVSGYPADCLDAPLLRKPYREEDLVDAIKVLLLHD